MSKYILPTYSGIMFDLLEPTEEMINIIDVAHHLSIENRFNGATNYQRSVALHSLDVSRNAPDEWKLEALLHDAEEAYYKDFPAPLKELLREGGELRIYDDMTYRFMNCLASKFKLSRKCGADLVSLDKKVGVVECDRLLTNFPEQFRMSNYQNLDTKNITICEMNLTAENVEELFLKEFNRLRRD